MISAKRNILMLEIGEVVRSTLFILPVFLLFFQEQVNLDFSDFMLSEAFFAAIVLGLEVPSGYLSDIWKRKIVMFLCYVFYFLAFAILLIADNIWYTLAFQGCLAISWSLLSGTNSALLYDSLLENDRIDDFSKYEGRRRALGLYTTAFCCLVGGVLYNFSPLYPVYASLIAAPIGMIASLLIQEPTRVKKTVGSNPFLDALSTMKFALHGHKTVAMIIIFAAALFASTKLIMWSQQPFYKALDIPEYLYGFLMAAGFMMGGVASHINHIIGKYLSNFQMLIGSWLLAVLICICAGLILNIFGYIGIGLLMFGGAFLFGAAMPRVNDAINRRVESDRRATILSTMSLLQELLYIPLSLLIGQIVTAYNVSYGLYAIALWLTLAGLSFAFWKKGEAKNFAD